MPKPKKMPKPKTRESLRPPIRHIGDAGWDAWLRSLLAVAQWRGELESTALTPALTTSEEIAKREAVLGVSLPASVKLFLAIFGPMEFDCFAVFPPEKMDFLSHFPLRFTLSPEQKIHATKMIVVAEEQVDEGGSLVDFYGLDLQTGKIYCCSNFYGVFYEYLPSFDNLIIMNFLELSAGICGWDEDHIQEWAWQIAEEDLGLLDSEGQSIDVGGLV